MRCKFCSGLGYILVELGSSPRYRCTDCNGSGAQAPADELDGDDCEDPSDDEDERYYESRRAGDTHQNSMEIAGFE